MHAVLLGVFLYLALVLLYCSCWILCIVFWHLRSLHNIPSLSSWLTSSLFSQWLSYTRIDSLPPTNQNPLITTTMTTSIGGMSTSVLAVISVAGVGALLALITITAWLYDLPARRRRKQAAKDRETGRWSASMNEAEVDVEKNEPAVSVTETHSLNSQPSKSTLAPRAQSPLCQCECPSIMPPSAMHSPLPSHTVHN
jgi:hypothetical protein